MEKLNTLVIGLSMECVSTRSASTCVRMANISLSLRSKSITGSDIVAMMLIYVMVRTSRFVDYIFIFIHILISLFLSCGCNFDFRWICFARRTDLGFTQSPDCLSVFAVVACW